MKKLLCVLMFGMVFGQDAITTREYRINITNETTEINFMELIGGSEGYYKVVPLVIEDVIINTTFDACLDGDDVSCEIRLVIQNNNMDGYVLEFQACDEENCFIKIDEQEGEVGHIVINSNFPTLDFIYNYNDDEDWWNDDCGNCPMEGETDFSGTFVFRISGKFSDSDVGLQGDMNDDDELDILDVVMMVDIIMSGGMGDVGDLLNVVRG